MPLLYTTIEAISNRLEGRITIGGPQQPTGKKVLDPSRVEAIGLQIESRLNIQLRQLYNLPLTRTDPDSVAVLASIVEKLTICELAPTVFRQPVNGSNDEYGALMCRQGNAELAALLSGAIELTGETPAGSTSASDPPAAAYVGKRQPLNDPKRLDAMEVKW